MDLFFDNAKKYGIKPFDEYANLSKSQNIGCLHIIHKVQAA